ncbi:MAG TPA: c-type cytochrome [Blastocatellia bacterium]|nr:c-type cytochrome [Blastocatellia bacterium]
MKKEYVTYGIIGVVLGLALGFMVANRSSSGASASPQAGAGGRTQASVNSASNQPELPAGHPPIDPSNPVPARPLPADSGSSSMAATSQSEESTELPSLDPLPSSSREERAERKYKNIQMLRGLPSERIEKVMFAFKASLGVECTYCHIKDQFEKDDKPTKQVARKMIQMTRAANREIGGAGRVTCFTCHRGQPRPPG